MIAQGRESETRETPMRQRTDCYCNELRKAGRRLSARYDAALAPAGVNVGQFSMLRQVDHAGEISLTELGRRAELDRSTVGRNARVLVRGGLLDSAPGADRREASLRLTPQGRETLAAAFPLWTQAQAEIEAALGRDAAKALRRVLSEI